MGSKIIFVVVMALGVAVARNIEFDYVDHNYGSNNINEGNDGGHFDYNNVGDTNPDNGNVHVDYGFDSNQDESGEEEESNDAGEEDTEDNQSDEEAEASEESPEFPEYGVASNSNSNEEGDGTPFDYTFDIQIVDNVGEAGEQEPTNFDYNQDPAIDVDGKQSNFYTRH